jgi:serine/threonine protein kinase
MTHDPLIGQQLGTYRLDRVLGRGGMAQVYYGWDLSLDRPVAVKVIDARYRESPAYAARFVREARTVATWRHPNIIQVYYAGEEDGLYYFAMEYVEGLDLRTLVDRYASDGELMPHADVLRLGRAIADALDYAHARGVIHRDVKPSNVMVETDGRVVLTDFGLALDVEQGSLGETFGSPHYIAPEQARSSAAAIPQSDLYALGVILYELLTGAVPFDDPSSTVVAVQHLTQPPPPPREFNPNLAPAVEAVLFKALNKAPEERYPSGRALLDALKAALEAPAPDTRLVSPTSRGPSLSRVSVHDQVAAHVHANASAQAEAAAPEEALIGQQLADFRLEELLGHGGMARVYRGVELPVQRRVAIKVIDAPFRADPDYLMRFEREAQAIAKLEHPHIVRLYRYGKDRGMLYMAMQYIDGADLEAVLASYREAGEFIEPHHVRRIVRDICEALDYVHARGVIHRDIKPANIMIDQQDHAILTDFGLALLTETGTRGMIFGSPHYIAPEQAVSSANVVPQSDIYALGVILYEMFTGDLPFEAEDPVDVAMQHMTSPPPPPSERRPELNPAVEAVILKALEKKPAQRYATGAALADALDAALGTTKPASDAMPSLYQRGTLLSAPPPGRPAAAKPTSEPTPSTPSSKPGTPPPTSEPVAPAPPASTPTPPPPAPTRRRRPLLLYVGVALLSCLILAMLTLGAVYVGARMARRLSTTPTVTLTEPPEELGATTANPTPVQATPVPTQVSTATAMPDPTATPSPTATALATTLPTATPSPTASPTATPEPSIYELLFVPHRDESLYIVNQGPDPLTLAPLTLYNDRDRVTGDLWDVAPLESGACVVWGREEDAALPKGLTCTLVDSYLAPYEGQPFWKSGFTVRYDEATLGRCPRDTKRCVTLAGTDTADLPRRYNVHIAKHKKDGFFLINQGDEAFPLPMLLMSNERGHVSGWAWEITELPPGACVVVWKDDGDIKAPKDVSCDLMGNPQIRETFWEETFDVTYEGEELGACKEDRDTCTFQLGYGEEEDEDDD